MSNDNQAYETSEAERNWIISITNMLVMVEKSSKMSICKVPNKLSKFKEDAYTPSIVSIGPFHHNNKAMLAFEEEKQQYMSFLFTRISQDAKSTFQDCATAILKLEKTSRRCYSEEIGFSKLELAEILLVDGCFLLELFLQYSTIDNTVGGGLINNAQTIATLQHDLALLENQIPFSVLETLFRIIKDHVPQPSGSSLTEHNVATLALLFFKSALGLSNEAIQSKAKNLPDRYYDHLLDILHKFYTHTNATNAMSSELPIFAKISHSRDLKRRVLRDCATKLLKAGIQFEANTADANENLLDINFSDTGVVTMPPLHIQEAITETIFRNLIAFEQCSGTGSTSHHIASYVFLMRSLLHSSHDVGILHEKGIIKYEFSDGGGGGGGGEDATSLFESLCNGVVLNDFYFSTLCEDVNRDYCNRISQRRWGRLYLILDDSRRTLYLNLDDCWRTTKHKWRGYMLDLFNVYLKNPWTTLKVIAAVLLLIFTALQTYYTIVSYYK